MERTLLYYPTIGIPNKKWIYTALLFSDKISSIVPYDHIIEEKEFQTDLKDLFYNGLYDPIYINKFIDSSKHDFQDLENEFIATVESDLFVNNIQNDKSNYTYFDRLFNTKMSDKIYFFMKDHNYIKDTDSISIYVNEKVTLLYMSILAQYIANVTDDKYITPSTDDKRYENIAFKSSNHDEQYALNIILKKCIPSPIESSPIESIIEFKKKRREELLNFRKYIKNFQFKITNAKSNTDKKEIIVGAKEDIELGINELDRLYKDSNINTSITTFDSLIKTDEPEQHEASTSSSIVGIGSSIGGTILVGSKSISTYCANKEKIDNSEFSYLFHAKKSGLVE